MRTAFNLPGEQGLQHLTEQLEQLRLEAGFVNVVIWERVFQRYRLLAKTASFLGVTGKLQVQSGVVHLVAEKLWAPRVRLKPSKTKSRNFH